MAGVGLTALPCLVRLGSPDGATLVVSQRERRGNSSILDSALRRRGSFLLAAALIFIACLVTAVGLTCASEFSRSIFPLSYRTLVFYSRRLLYGGVKPWTEPSIQISIPVLTAIYPPCITHWLY